MAAIIAVGAYRLTKESGHILLEGVPAGYEIKYIAENLEKHFDYLTAVNHIHLWAINEDQVMMTLHAKIDLDHVNDVTLAEIKQYLLDVHKIHHVTLQLESQIGANSIKRDVD